MGAPEASILIVDDQQLFADGLRIVIESRAPEFCVVGIANDGRQAISMVEALKPSLVLMDVRMPIMDGVEATKLIHNAHPGVKVLILTTFSDDEYVTRSLRYGAVGYLLKNRPAEEIVKSLRALQAGILQIDPAVSEIILATKQKTTASEGEFVARLHTLSRREVEVLTLMMKAKRIAEIAFELNIAKQTVRNHISNLYYKLAIHDRLDIVNYFDTIQAFLVNRG